MFEGPIFIVGRPRSGTKLLRELLNRHSCISIPFWESNVIPRYAMKAKTLGQMGNREGIKVQLDWFCRTEFYRKITGERGYPQIDKELWLSSITDLSYPGMVAALFKLYASFQGKRIWGDKSPNYLVHMPLLKELFPEAKFIHIMRDVRDNCLSILRIWGIHPLRSAQLWSDSIVKCRNDAQTFSAKDYYEIKYESLLQNPRSELERICDFLGLSFEDTMTELERPLERRGGTSEATHIVSSNMEKWLHEFSPRLVERIEELSLNTLQDLGYQVAYAKRQTRLSSSQLFLLKGMDVWNRFKFDCGRQGGIAKAVIYQYRKRRFG